MHLRTQADSGRERSTNTPVLLAGSIPGKYAVERYPALKYIPSIFAPWKAEVLEQRKKDIQMYTGLMDDVKRRLAAGVLPDCFAKHLLEEQHSLGMSDLEVAYTAGTPFGAGVETVRSSNSHLLHSGD
jgi:hypothetical protein